MKILVIALAASAVVLGRVDVSPAIAQGESSAAHGPSAEAFTRVCSNCHSPERIVSTRRSRDQWQEVVENMASRGAQGTDDDLAAVMKYLVANYGRVNINRAPVDDIVEVLAVAVADAQKIVEYRKAHGNFPDMDALVAVPGIDVEKIKPKREAITF